MWPWPCCFIIIHCIKNKRDFFSFATLYQFSCPMTFVLVASTLKQSWIIKLWPLCSLISADGIFWASLRRLGGQPINHQISLKFSDMICLAINHCFVKKSVIYLNFYSWVFSYIFIQRSSSKGDKYGLKMATTTWHQHQIEPLMASTVYFRGYIQVPLQFTSEVFIATISMILLTTDSWWC